MDSLAPIGKLLLVAGGILILIGLLLAWGLDIPWLGRLPGDIALRRGNFRIYFPLTTSILLSVVITLILYLLRR
jgi:hypothetical protein